MLRLPDAAEEGVMHCPASTGRLARVKMAETPSAVPVNFRRDESTPSVCVESGGVFRLSGVRSDMAGLEKV